MIQDLNPLLIITNCGLVLVRPSDSQSALVQVADADIHAVAGLLKMYLRDLPEPLFTDELYPKFVEANGTFKLHFFVTVVLGSMFRIATLCDWLKHLAPLFQPNPSKMKTNPDLPARVLPCLSPATCICFIFANVRIINSGEDSFSTKR